MPIFGCFWVFCPKSAVGWKSGFATIPEKLPGHLGIPIYHINHIWSHLPSLERCIRGCSEILDLYMYLEVFRRHITATCTNGGKILIRSRFSIQLVTY